MFKLSDCQSRVMQRKIKDKTIYHKVYRVKLMHSIRQFATFVYHMFIYIEFQSKFIE